MGRVVSLGSINVDDVWRVPEEEIAALADLADEPDRPTVILDPAPAEGAETLLGHGAVDVLTPNEGEYGGIRSALGEFDGTLVRTHGSDDVVVDPDDGDRFTVAPPRVEAVDTTGAGDVLDGFLGARLAAGTPLPGAVEVATVAASLSTREAGARDEIPTLEEVRAFRAPEAGGEIETGSGTGSG